MVHLHALASAAGNLVGVGEDDAGEFASPHTLFNEIQTFWIRFLISYHLLSRSFSSLSPQAMYNWSTAKGYDTLPLMQACVGSEANNSVVNCFGFPCTGKKVSIRRLERNRQISATNFNPSSFPFYFKCFHPHSPLYPVSKPFKPSNGGRRVTLATCRCPVGSNTDGYPLPLGAPFQHEGGQCNSDYCSRLPVGIPYDGSAAAWQCVGLPPPLPPKKEVVG